MAVYICTCIEKTIYLDFKTLLLTLRNKGYRYTGVYIYLDLTQVYFQMTLSFSVNQTEVPVFIEVLVLPVFTIHWFFNVQEI